MQDNFVFSDTVERNIVLGATTDRDRLADAIDIACLDGYVASRPMGVATMLGSEGNGLSGGERQRVMMARVAYKHPPT